MPNVETGPDEGPKQPVRRLLNPLSGAAVLVLWVGVLIQALTGLAFVAPATLGALALYLLLQAPQLPRTAWVHLTVGAAVTLFSLWWLEHPGEAVMAALGRAAFLAALFAALGALREAARGSDTVLTAGRLLARQPPGRRYAAMTLGGTLFGTILNFGAVALLGGMVRDANTLQSAGGDRRIQAIRERRMLLAVLRGFSVLMFWSPLTVAFAIVTTTVAGTAWPSLMLFGGLAAISVLTLGWAIDRLTMPRPRVPAAAEPFRWQALAPLFGLLGLVFGLSLLVDETTDGALIHGVILVVPLIALSWLALGKGVRHSTGRMGSYLGETVPTQRAEIAVLGNAAFLGTLIAALLSESGAEAALDQAQLPPLLIAVVMPWLVVVFGQLGANPLISVTVLAAVIGDPARFGVEPTVFGLGLVMGWGLTVGSSPAAAATMMIGRLSGCSARAIGRDWNGLHSLLALLLCSLLLAVGHFVG
ncbi:hypothetical protein [Algihabitans albus]|uniref:hypothetical protein n=1 Tax=Algihabitans albus TaxID=2164067 RepID=UPI0013C2BBC9|nr:hypothetical protein [Algihabitans albus]